MEIEFSDKELKALKQEYASQATDAQFTLWIETCKRRGLVPVEDVVLQLRSAREYDEVAKAKVYVRKVVFITTLRALLKLAERTGKYKGFVTAQYIYLDDKQQPTIISEFPLPDPKAIDKPLIPWAAKAGIKRNGFDEPQYEIARFWAYAQTFEDDGKKKLNSTWTTRGPEQLVKCARAAALRGSFPEECGDLFLQEEIQNEEVAPQKTEAKTEPQKSTAPAVTPAAPPVNHTPAEGKVAPRPGEKTEKVDTTSPVQTTTAPAPTVQTATLPDYTPPLTVANKIEHNQQAQAALNAATADPAATSAAEAKPPVEKKGSHRKKKEAPEKIEAPAAPASAPAAIEPAQPTTTTVSESTPAAPGDRVPTLDEFSATLSALVKFRDRLGGAGSQGSQSLKHFILTKADQPDTKLITVNQWAEILKVLNSALDDADLKSIVSK